MGKGIFIENTSLWVEKYRPQSLDEYIGNNEMKEKFGTFLSKKEIPNLLLSGPPGTGKSSFANLIVKSIPCDFKYINASNESGIETVRTKILQFCNTAGFEDIKILVLDEADGLTPTSQLALRPITEQYSKYTRFIFTCNIVERIIPPLRSRCQEFQIIPPSKEEVKKRCEFILKEEKVDYEDHELQSIVDINYPDIRKCIQVLEQSTINKILKLDKQFFKLLKFQERTIEILKSTKSSNVEDKITEIRQLLADSKIKDYTNLYTYLFERLDDYTKKNKIVKIIAHLQEGLKCDGFVANKEINMVATLVRICEEIV